MKKIQEILIKNSYFGKKLVTFDFPRLGFSFFMTIKVKLEKRTEEWNAISFLVPFFKERNAFPFRSSKKWNAFQGTAFLERVPKALRALKQKDKQYCILDSANNFKNRSIFSLHLSIV